MANLTLFDLLSKFFGIYVYSSLIETKYGDCKE